jgi:hypothetical protein
MSLKYYVALTWPSADEIFCTFLGIFQYFAPFFPSSTESYPTAIHFSYVMTFIMSDFLIMLLCVYNLFYIVNSLNKDIVVIHLGIHHDGCSIAYRNVYSSFIHSIDI